MDRGEMISGLRLAEHLSVLAGQDTAARACARASLSLRQQRRVIEEFQEWSNHYQHQIEADDETESLYWFGACPTIAELKEMNRTGRMLFPLGMLFAMRNAGIDPDLIPDATIRRVVVEDEIEGVGLVMGFRFRIEHRGRFLAEMIEEAPCEGVLHTWQFRVTRHVRDLVVC